MSEQDFALHDCSLARLATGRSCTNLRELLETLRDAPDAVLRHHMMRCALENYFDLYEFPNDLARWCWDALGDRELAEELGLINPYALPTVDELRHALVDTVENRLWALERVPWCRPGHELHIIESRIICFDTGERFGSLAAFAEALPKISLRSLYYHVHEAHRRQGVDDISAWLERLDADKDLVRKIRTIDFYFSNLNQLRRQLFDILCAAVPELAALVGLIR
ncbi:MAG: hypothetical protein K1X74_21655 [Pirellulales bacterium]|nr:hypothetical protein [Pirellulales bacterium]